MIIIKYLAREIVKSQIAILLVLVLIFFSQKLVRILAAAVEGDIPASLVLALLGFGIAGMVQLILPLSLFFGILITLSKLYQESEITVMHACGLGKRMLVIAVLILAGITSMASAINVIWLVPWSAKHQEKVLAAEKANPSLAAMVEGEFRVYQDGQTVLFVGDVNKHEINRIFLAQLRSGNDRRPSVVIADQGQILERHDGSKVILFNKGTRYEGSAVLHDFRVTDFVNYQAVISRQTVGDEANTNAAQMSMNDLWHATQPDVIAEFHWRLTLICSVIIMALMAIPLSVVNPRHGRMLSMIPAMLLYLIFFLLQSTLRSHVSSDRLDPVWIWVVNSAYLMMAIVLNVWDSLPVRQLRARCFGGAL